MYKKFFEAYPRTGDRKISDIFVLFHKVLKQSFGSAILEFWTHFREVLCFHLRIHSKDFSEFLHVPKNAEKLTRLGFYRKRHLSIEGCF